MPEIDSRIGVTQHSLVKEAKGAKIELDVILVTHVDGHCYAFCDAGKPCQDDPATKSYSGIFHTRHQTVVKAQQSVWKQAESFAKELVQQKLLYEANKSL